LVIVGKDAAVDDAALQAYLNRGGKVVVLPRGQGTGLLGVQYAAQNDFAGASDVPTWPEAAGLSRSDLRLRAETPMVLVNGGCEVGAGGLLGRQVVGKNGGVALFCQADPEALPADQKTYLRYSRWRQTRALCQVLGNLRASFQVDARIFHPADVETLWLAGAWQGKQTLVLPKAPSPEQGHVDPGVTDQARAAIGPDIDESGWQKLELPKMLPIFSESDGELVFRRTITIPQEWAGKDLLLSLGNVDDFDDAFLDGQLVGRTDQTTKEYWSAKRNYRIPGKLVKAGKAVLALRVFDRFGGGGFGGQRGEMFIKPDAGAAAGNWYHRDYRSDFELGDDPFRYFRW